MKICSTLNVIRKLQIKTTMQCYYASVRVPNIQDADATKR